MNTLHKNISLVTYNHLCTGCGTCKVICPHNAISMQKTNIGRLFADIDTDLCTDCGACMEICPGYDKNDYVIPVNINPFEGVIKNTYTGISTNEYIYENSQSGGLVTECLSYLFDTKRIDAAVVCTTDYGTDRPFVSALIVVDKQQLLLSQRSSYTPVDMVSALEYTRIYKKVAFVGLPCHIQGVISLQHKYKKYDNIIFKFGLICERSLSEAVADIFTSEMTNIKKKKIYWKLKKGYVYKNAPVVVENEDGETKVIPASKRHLLKDYFTSPRCRICFDKMNIHSDITFGDPWGMSNIDWQKGESLVVTRTDKGENLIQNLIQEGRVKLNIASFEEVRQGQGLEKRKSQVKIFFEVYRKHNWLLPNYVAKLNLSVTSNLIYGKCEKLIKDYFDLESKDRNSIIKEVNKQVGNKIIKNKIKNILQMPFRVLKQFFKSIKL